MRWCRGDIRRQIEFFDPLVTIAPRALINPPFRSGSCPKSVTHVSLLICYPCPPTIPSVSLRVCQTNFGIGCTICLTPMMGPCQTSIFLTSLLKVSLVCMNSYVRTESVSQENLHFGIEQSKRVCSGTQ